MNWINTKDKLPPSVRNQRLMIIDAETNEHKKAHFNKGDFFHEWDYANFYPIKTKIEFWFILPEPTDKQ